MKKILLTAAGCMFVFALSAQTTTSAPAKEKHGHEKSCEKKGAKCCAPKSEAKCCSMGHGNANGKQAGKAQPAQAATPSTSPQPKATARPKG